MENHPIPQDVTGFKFKLIGSVTVKQFLYLIGGGILAAITFVLPITGFIKYPLSLLFGGLGAALAFVPVEGRPMDVMIKNFLRALPSENQYIFKKRGAEALITEFFSPAPAASLKMPQQATSQKTDLDTKRALLYRTLRQNYQPDEKEQAVLNNINTYLSESSHSASPSIQNIDSAPQESVSPLTQIATPTPRVVDITEAVKVVAPPTPPETPVAKPTPPMQEVEKPQAPPPPPAEPPALRVVVESPAPPPAPEAPMTTTPAAAQAAGIAPNESANVKSVGPEATLKAGFPQLPDTPNIVMGIIKDPRGKVIPNILVEIMDLQGIPVRAFKTNALGQFAAATPLPNGEYNVILEDPRKQNEFEQIHIALDGTIFQPLEINSIDQREKLRRELFGGVVTATRRATI